MGLVTTPLSGSGIAAFLSWSGWCGSRVGTCSDPEGTPKALLTHTSTTSTITQPGDATTRTCTRGNHPCLCRWNYPR